MGLTIVRLVIKSLNWVAFGVGISLNVLLVHLILCKTPKSMRMYSKILLQTCLTDMLLLTMTVLFQPYYFSTAKGEQEAILDGVLPISGPIWAPLLASVSWIFLVYVSMIGYVSQFIFRYLALNWNKQISCVDYFFLLTVLLSFPLIYCVNLFLCYFPPVGHTLMDDQSVAHLLGLDLSANIVLAGYTFNDVRVSFGFYYIIIICTMAYVTMFVLACLIHRFLRQRSRLGASSELTKRMITMNKQISRNLIIQASMPFLIYLSIVFLLVIFLFQIDVSGWHWLQYYNLSVTIPMHLPSALNPIVSICIIKYFRHAFWAGTERIVRQVRKCFCVGVLQLQPQQKHRQQQTIATNLQQQPQQKWALQPFDVSVRTAKVEILDNSDGAMPIRHSTGLAENFETCQMRF